MLRFFTGVSMPVGSVERLKMTGWIALLLRVVVVNERIVSASFGQIVDDMLEIEVEKLRGRWYLVSLASLDVVPAHLYIASQVC